MQNIFVVQLVDKILKYILLYGVSIWGPRKNWRRGSPNYIRGKYRKFPHSELPIISFIIRIDSYQIHTTHIYSSVSKILLNISAHENPTDIESFSHFYMHHCTYNKHTDQYIFCYSYIRTSHGYCQSESRGWNIFYLNEIELYCVRTVALFYHNSPSFSLAGTSMTRGLSMILAVRCPFSTIPTIQPWYPSCFTSYCKNGSCC